MVGERSVVITTEEMEAVRIVLEYMAEDEQDDYECREPEDRENHIWLSVKALWDWYHAECVD
jgi:hypothetical protein